MHNFKKNSQLTILLALLASYAPQLHAATEANPYGLHPIQTEIHLGKKVLADASNFWRIVDKNPVPPLHSFTTVDKAVLVCGEIDSGKSTTTYYLADHTFTRQHRAIITNNKAVRSKIAGYGVGDKTRMFEVIHPQTRKPHRDWCYVDFPGFINIHNDQQQLYNAFAFRLCVSRVHSVHALLFVVRCDRSDNGILNQVASFAQNDLKDFLKWFPYYASYYKEHLFCVLTRFDGKPSRIEQTIRKLFQHKASQRNTNPDLKRLLDIFATPGHTIAIDPCDDASAPRGKTTRDQLERALITTKRTPLKQTAFNMDFFSQGNRMQQVQQEIIQEVVSNDIMRVIHQYYDKYQKISYTNDVLAFTGLILIIITLLSLGLFALGPAGLVCIPLAFFTREVLLSYDGKAYTDAIKKLNIHD